MRRDGFTVLELVVALGLGAVLAGVATVRLATLAQGVRVAGSARTVATALRLARGRALASGGSIEVRFDASRATCETRDGAGVVMETRRLPPGVAFTALPARARILFGSLGTAENGTITLGAGTRERSVVVNQRGRVRLS